VECLPSRPSFTGVVGQFDVASTAIIVAVILAKSRVRLESNTEPSQTVSVRPAWTTFPATISRSVFAAFKKWTLTLPSALRGSPA